MTTLEPNHRILVIDDNSAIHDDFRKILAEPPPLDPELEEVENLLFGSSRQGPSQAHFHIDSAFQGQQGLEMARQAAGEGRPYAMAFVDVRMPPGWDGIETISHLWKDCADLQVVICTAYSDYSWPEITKILGQSDSMVILKKPFDNVEVLQLAHALTKKWLLGRQAKARLDHLDQLVRERTSDLELANERLRFGIAQLEFTEQALRLSEERFVKAFQATPIPLAIQTFPDQRYLDANESYLELTGYTRAELAGKSHSSFQIDADESAAAVRLENLRTAHSLRNLGGKVRSKDGQLHDVLVSLELFQLGVEPHLLLIFQDITDRIRLESQLRQAQKMEAVGQLAAGIAHDFNNILTVIQGHAGLVMVKTTLEREIEDSVRQIHYASERAASLTRQLLAFSRKQVMHFKPMQPNDRLHQLSELLKRLIGETIRLECDLDPKLPRILADGGCFDQIVINLAVNARDAMPGGGTLSIRTRCADLSPDAARANPEARAGVYARIEVADTGCGIPPEILSRIFEPFFTTKDVGKGTGLGLSTVYGIVKQHGGWIEASSQPGQGSTFSLFLPAADAEPSAPSLLAAPRNRSAQHASILVVEDEDPVRHLTCRILELAGFSVLSAANGREAIQMFSERSAPIDILLTDMVMPEGVSGRGLADALRTEDSKLKVIFTSGYSTDLLEDQLKEIGRCWFLQKPYAGGDLIQILEECLGSESHPARPSTSA